MSWLYEEINIAKKFNAYKDLPQFVKDNLNPSFQVRPYQEDALRNFITYYETDSMHVNKSIHTLFHMATGSGKTYIMAGLIIYLYSKGYRNFLFFVNLSQIVKKTIDNFLNPASSKYLFAKEIKIDGKTIHINKVNNFQECNPHDINILFDTTAGLHSDLTLIKENMPSIEDFLQDKTVLIADEAHHLNTATKDKKEIENEHSWETTVNKIKNTNSENIMLEFTATCDIGNSEIRKKYEDKIIFDYDLPKYRADKYSKDIYTLRSDFPQTEDGRLLRSLQALIVSQYKLKMFQKMKLNVKPVVLFKSKTIKESHQNKELIIEYINSLKAADIVKIRNLSAESELMKTIFSYFKLNKITDSALVNEIKLSFTREVSIDVNDDAEAEKNQLIVNSLEDETNPFRMIFEVEKLDEGWDCLNLFDIVRLYETRDSKGDKPGKSTIHEAQLIGRGARYYPFEYNDKDKYKRKFDSDIENPLRICEQLHYHCQNDSRYINELNNALKEFGITDADDSKKIQRHNDIKKSFLNNDLYKKGFVFVNSIKKKEFTTITDIQEIQQEYSFILTGSSVEETQMLNEETTTGVSHKIKEYTVKKTIKELVNTYCYNLIHSEFVRFNNLTFENISSMFPEVKSIKQFITEDKYLGNIALSVTSEYEEPLVKQWSFVLQQLFAFISIQLSMGKQNCTGSTEFLPKPLREVFERKGTDRNYTITDSDGDGIAQKDCADSEIRFDLSSQDWYVYSENYGTTEEKRFVKYFAEHCIPDLQKKYTEIKLIRNECQASIFSFNDGRRFEPDYLLFLKNKNTSEYEYTQVFIEPKGKNLLAFDEWKEKFLLELEKQSIPLVQYADDKKYKIWGLHFYCHGERDKDFIEDMKKLCK